MTLPKTDKIEEAWSFMKERLSNPLVYSFLFSWLIINWKITVGLIWYSEAMLKRDGFKSYIDFISSNLNNNWTLFQLPLLIAFGYAFVFPPLRHLISAYNSFNYRWGTKLSLGLMKEGKISVDKYLSLRKNLDERKIQLEKAIELESTAQVRFEAMQLERDDLRMKYNRLDEDYRKRDKTILDLTEDLKGAKDIVSEKSSRISELDDELDDKLRELEKAKALSLKTDQKYLEATDVISKLNGEWALAHLEGNWYNRYTYNDKVNNMSGEEDVKIKGRDYYTLFGDNREELVALLTFVSFNPMTNKLVFIKELVSKYAYAKPANFPSRGACLVNVLTVNEDWTEMAGTEDGNIKIVYSRETAPTVYTKRIISGTTSINK